MKNRHLVGVSKTSVFILPRENQNPTRSKKTEIVPVNKKSAREKNRKTSKKCP